MLHVFIELFIYSLIGILVVWKLPYFNLNGFKKHIVIALYIIKLIAGTSVYYIYAFYYGGGDIFLYFTDGLAMAEQFDRDFTMGLAYWFGAVPTESIKSILPHTIAWDYSDCRSIIRLNALTYFITGPNYFLNTPIINLFYLHSGIYFFNSLHRNLAIHKYYGILSIFLIPSVLFWGSSFLKDALFLMSLFYVMGNLINSYYHKKLDNYIWLLLSLLFMAWIKPLSMVFLIPGLVYLGIHRYFNTLLEGRKLLWVIVVGLAMLQAVALLPAPFNLLEHLSNYQQKHMELAAEGWSSESMFWVPAINNNVFVFIGDLIVGLFNGIFQPIYTKGKLFNVLQLVENIALFIVVLWLIYQHLKQPKTISPISGFMLVTAVFSLCLLGLSVPIAGALVRYRIFAMPLLTIGLLLPLGQSSKSL